MTSRDFAFWLQGFFEIQNPNIITNEQIVMIKKHLNMVFNHEIDPTMGDKHHQEKLNQVHNSFIFLTNEEEAIIKFGPKPSDEHELSIHGWYHPNEGKPRC